MCVGGGGGGRDNHLVFSLDYYVRNNPNLAPNWVGGRAGAAEVISSYQAEY